MYIQYIYVEYLECTYYWSYTRTFTHCYTHTHSYYHTHTHPYIYTGVKYLPLYDTANFIKLDADVILIAVSIISFEDVVRSLPVEMLKGKLIVDVLSVKVSVCYVLCAYLSDVYMCHY